MRPKSYPKAAMFISLVAAIISFSGFQFCNQMIVEPELETFLTVFCPVVWLGAGAEWVSYPLYRQIRHLRLYRFSKRYLFGVLSFLCFSIGYLAMPFMVLLPKEEGINLVALAIFLIGFGLCVVCYGFHKVIRIALFRE